MIEEKKHNTTKRFL